MKKSIIINGGLGNQLFQFSFYLYLKKYKKNVYLDLSTIERYKLYNGFELNDMILKKDLSTMIIKSSYFKYLINSLIKFIPFNTIYFYNELRNQRFCYKKDVLKRKYFIYRGYWQNTYVVREVINEMKSLVNFHMMDGINRSFAEKLEKECSVSVHVRRGDYLGNETWNTVTKEYYLKAIDIIKLKTENKCKFYFFSNDIEWVKSNLADSSINFEIVEFNKGKNSYKDMYLMTKCKYNIIANSTFSWWAATLNTRKNIVFCPKIWKNQDLKNGYDIYFNDWIKI